MWHALLGTGNLVAAVADMELSDLDGLLYRRVAREYAVLTRTAPQSTSTLQRPAPSTSTFQRP